MTDYNYYGDYSEGVTIDQGDWEEISDNNLELLMEELSLQKKDSYGGKYVVVQQLDNQKEWIDKTVKGAMDRMVKLREERDRKLSAANKKQQELKRKRELAKLEELKRRYESSTTN